MKHKKGLLLGAVLGLLAGILFAPKSGKETRQDLKKSTRDAAKKSGVELQKIHDQLSELAHKAKRQARGASEDGKRKIEQATHKAEKARDQAAGVIAALRSGNSTDEDLQNAIGNAKQALVDIRRFLNK